MAEHVQGVLNASSQHWLLITFRFLYSEDANHIIKNSEGAENVKWNLHSALFSVTLFLPPETVSDQGLVYFFSMVIDLYTSTHK